MSVEGSIIREGYRFTAQGWGMHSVDDQCDYAPPLDIRRTSYLTHDVDEAIDAKRRLEEFLKSKPAEPIRTYRAGVDVAQEMVPPGTVLAIYEEDYYAERNTYAVGRGHWGIVLKHNQYGEEAQLGVVGIPRGLAEDNKGKIPQVTVDSLEKRGVFPTCRLFDLPIAVGTVNHMRTRIHAGDPNSLNFHERLRAVLYPEETESNYLTRITRVELWYPGSTDKSRANLGFGILFGRPQTQVG